MNLSASLNIFKLIRDPALCLPHSSVSTFNHLPIPISKAFSNHDDAKRIRAVVLDKDNCFATPHENTVYKPYSVPFPAPIDKFKQLREAYPGNRLLIVSNSAGTGDDPDGKEADLLEKNTGVKVLRHGTKVGITHGKRIPFCLTRDYEYVQKPGCRAEIFSHFVNSKDTGVTSPDQIAIVGDRLFTDVVMANMMGSWGIWISAGVVKEKSFVSSRILSPSVEADAPKFTRIESRLFDFLVRRGRSAPKPLSVFK
ncbi:MAG: hypothetical protein M1840_000765 [Geoglossum simile]|nr:MAG: hypothetical protein M1840_000765 [Geoglossum simile]